MLAQFRSTAPGGAPGQYPQQQRRRHQGEEEEDDEDEEEEYLGPSLAQARGPLTGWYWPRHRPPCDACLAHLQVIGAAGMGFGRALDALASRWGAPDRNPLEEALQQARQETQHRAEERRAQQQAARVTAARITVEVGAGAWAR